MGEGKLAGHRHRAARDAHRVARHPSRPADAFRRSGSGRDIEEFLATRTATFTVSGKYYYDSYWDIGVAVDQRPALFPFLVSLVHVLGGYSYKHVFLFNLMVLPAFVLVSYRLAKTLGGETFASVAALLVVAHPITLLSVRSGGFDFFCGLFCFARDQKPA